MKKKDGEGSMSNEELVSSFEAAVIRGALAKCRVDGCVGLRTQLLSRLNGENVRDVCEDERKDGAEKLRVYVSLGSELQEFTRKELLGLPREEMLKIYHSTAICVNAGCEKFDFEALEEIVLARLT